MYPSKNNSNQNPLFLEDEIHQYTTLYNKEIHPTPAVDHLPTASLFQFSYPLYEQTWHQLYDIHFQQQPLIPTIDPAASNMEDIKRIDATEEIRQDDASQKTSSTKRTSNKDRHSKITTAQGPRDRRMRLSLPVAQKIFSLQDVLGFDKASKTIEWLLMQSSSSINKVKRGHQQAWGIQTCYDGGADSISSASESEINSGSDKSTNSDAPQGKNCRNAKAESSFYIEKKEKLAHCSATHYQVARGSRKVARERARKRTIEKRKVCNSKILGEEMNLESWGQLEINEESGTQRCTSKIIDSLPTYTELPEVQDFSSWVMADNGNLSDLVCNHQQHSLEHDFWGFVWQ